MKIDIIRNDMTAAMKSGDKVKKQVLSAILARANSIAKDDKNREMTDNDIVTAIVKILKETNETLEYAIAGLRPIDELETHIAILESYMPKKLTDEELINEINSVKGDNDGKKLLGVVMKHLSANFKGRYDVQTVNQILAKV